MQLFWKTCFFYSVCTISKICCRRKEEIGMETRVYVTGTVGRYSNVTGGGHSYTPTPSLKKCTLVYETYMLC